MSDILLLGVTDQSIYWRVLDEDGAGVTGRDDGDFTVSYRRWLKGVPLAASMTSANPDDIHTNDNDSHADWYIADLGNGRYRYDIADAVAASGADAVEWEIVSLTSGDNVVYRDVIPLDQRISSGVDVVSWKGSTPADLVDTNKLSVSVQHMATGVLTADAIASAAITAAKLATGTITADKIAASAITAAKIAASALDGKGDWLTTLGTNAPAGWLNAAAFAAGALNGKGDWLTTLGTNAPAGWLNAAAVAAGALSGKGDWAVAGDAMTLTAGERTSLAAAMEAAIINELDGTAVMQAIADLIADDMTTGDLSVQAIASAVRDSILDRVLAGNHDDAGSLGKVIQDILADTNELQVADLATLIGNLNDLDATAVQTAAAAALTAYDPPTKAELDAGLANLATAAKLLAFVQLILRSDSAIETDLSAELAEVNADEGSGAGDYAPSADSQEATADAVAALSITSSGDYTIAFTIDDGTDPLEGVVVTATKGAERFASLGTDASGMTTLDLNAGTWRISLGLSGYTFLAVDLVVTGASSQTYSMSQASFTPSDPDKATGYTTMFNELGAAEEGVVVYLKCIEVPSGSGISLDSKARQATSNDSGLVQFANLIVGATYKIWGDGFTSTKTFVVPADLATFPIDNFLRKD